MWAREPGADAKNKEVWLGDGDGRVLNVSTGRFSRHGKTQLFRKPAGKASTSGDSA